MSTKRAHYLITKFLTDKLSEEEMQQLEQLLKDPENQALFSEVIQANFSSDYSLKKFSSESLQNTLRERIQKEKNPFYKKRMFSLMKYAAIFIFLLGITFFFKDSLFTNSNRNQQIVVKDDAIILELEDGRMEVLNPENSKVVQNGKGLVVGRQHKNVIQYSDSLVLETLVYNTLKVPYGKQFDLVLSDGTKVFLNSGTSIKYPVKFLSGKKREVFLKGEAFFDVQKDENHPFIVNANELDVAVLGTQFVVSLYEEDNEVSVVLVEGSVDLSLDDNPTTTRLTPGTRGALNYNTGAIRKKNVNTDVYTAWIEGILIFRNETFANISRKLERVYNITIVSSNPEFDKEVFNASFNNETIGDILSYFKDSHDMNYTIKDNIIYIN
ncbi:DUF4974 domain-containing protein [Flagellimonas hymeniacidonis]|uniref:DUF4974 domain-containing protein n=1 Tax=Flagellimonas hymeniacidonis TaxID=2603628 RepID=A0A5C8V6L7_9FLAO|nr:FecR family protein [Flagellimonas hymeniacidonis]TXN36779.1 DUF4974 domain-containing protein [Flagellimonas hymeniacidonis]